MKKFTELNEQLLTESAKGVSASDYITKFHEFVFKQVIKKLNRKNYEKVEVRVSRRGDRSMAMLEFSGYTNSDTEFSGYANIISAMPDGSNLLQLHLKGVNGSKTHDLKRFRNDDKFDVDFLAKAMNSNVEYMI